jgi:hypothetical protein
VGDAVKVDGDRLCRQGEEAVPVPAPLLVGLTGDNELPVLEVDAGGWARRQDGEVLDQVLAGGSSTVGRRRPLNPRDTVLMVATPCGLAEGESVGLDAGIQEGDLEEALDDRLCLG